MDQPPTHYQLSFTARQGLLLFVALLFALGLAYFFGLMTGLSGRPARAGADAGPTAPADASDPAAPTAQPVGGIRSRPTAAAPVRSSGSEQPAVASAPEPTAPAELQVFEDAGEPTPEPSRRVLAQATTPLPSAPADGFWVQVLSVSSEREARARSARLAHHKYHTAVVPASTGKGKVVYRVRVGPYRSREEAVRAAALLKSGEKVEPWIVPAGQ